MKNSEKIWAILVNFGVYKGEWFPDKPQFEIPFDEEMWDYIVEELEKQGRMESKTAPKLSNEIQKATQSIMQTELEH